MRSIAIAFVAALVAAPAVSAQQAVEQVPVEQTETRAEAAAPVTAVPATVAPTSGGFSGVETVSPNFDGANDAAAAAQVDNRTRNILAIVGAVVIVLALLAFI
jgi:Mn2+/Fe2+ NRAMP family transporter